MSVKYLNTEEAKESLKQDKVILYIGATWCGPCKMMQPLLEELSKVVSVVKVDADENKDFVKEMGVTGFPTIFIYKKGKITETFIGYTPKEKIEEKL